MTATTTAEFLGTCEECHGTIRPGDIIRGIDADGYAGSIRTAWVHDVCPTPRGTTTCPRCFLERPCPCEDEQ